MKAMRNMLRPGRAARLRATVSCVCTWLLTCGYIVCTQMMRVGTKAKEGLTWNCIQAIQIFHTVKVEICLTTAPNFRVAPPVLGDACVCLTVFVCLHPAGVCEPPDPGNLSILGHPQHAPDCPDNGHESCARKWHSLCQRCKCSIHGALQTVTWS